jgi:hypothetical protein
MTHTLDMPKIDAEARKAEEACANYVRCSLSWTWPGTCRAIKGDLRDEIVSGLEATSSAVSTSTKMWDWRNNALSGIKSLKAEVTAYWKRVTIDWPDEAGVRLLPKALVEEFEAQMRVYRDVLARSAGEVQAQRDAIMTKAKEQRGRAFCGTDYPTNLAALFGLEWGYSSLKVSEELKEISAAAWSGEKTRQMARLLGAVRTAEEATMRELHEAASKLTERLAAIDQPVSDGERRPALYASMLEAVQEFCSRHAAVVCWGCDDIDEVVREAGGAVEGVTIDEVRANRAKRDAVSTALYEVVRRLEGMMPDLTQTDKAA